MRNIVIAVKATPNNEPNTIVKRDANGDFSANAITATDITDDISIQKVEVAKDGSLVAARKRVNLVEGYGIDLTVTDNPSSNELDITIGVSGYVGGGGTSGFSGYSGQAGTVGPAGTSGYSGYSGVGLSGFSGYSGTANTTIGPAEDGTYTDGLFVDLVDTTPVGTFADKVNEVLKSLAPSPAPNFDSTSIAVTSSTAGSLTFGTSVPLTGYTSVTGIGTATAVGVDGVFTKSGKRQGITGSLSGISGVLADDISASTQSPTPAYPANSFGDGDKGNIHLEINGTIVRTYDLTTGSAVTDTGTGFVLSAATPVKFANGDSFTVFQYRTGTWIAASTNFVNGWNYARVRHEYATGLFRDAAYVDFVYDAATTATTFASEAISNVSLTPTLAASQKSLSGVKYFTGGSVTYSIQISNAYRNTYVTTGAIVYNRSDTTKITSITSDNLPASSGNQAATYSPSKTVNIASSGIRFNATAGNSFKITTTANRTVQTDLTSTGATLSNILLDNVAASSTITNESFDDENYRIPSEAVTNFDTSATAVTGSWTSTNSIANAGSSGYNDGLQVYNGTLLYPTINFSTYSNGPTSNVDYSTCSGARTYYRYFDMSGTARSNFLITVTTSATCTIVSSGTTFTNGSSQVKIDIKLPSYSSGSGPGTGWLDCSVPFATAQWTDGSGSLLSGTFSFNSAMSLTVGTKSTGSTGVDGKVFLRIRVPQGWTGIISNIQLVGN